MDESLYARLRRCPSPVQALDLLATVLEEQQAKITAIEAKLEGAGDNAWGAPLKWGAAPDIVLPDQPGPIDHERGDGRTTDAERGNAATAQQRKIAMLEEQILATVDPDERRALEATLRLAREEHVRLESPAVPPSVGEEVIGEGWASLAKQATPEQITKRMQWAASVNLEEYMRTAEALKMSRDAGGDSVEQLYAWFGKVGPRGLFTADHVACLQLPYVARRWLVEHMAEEDQVLAQDMGADLLKSEEGMDRETAKEMYEPTWKS